MKHKTRSFMTVFAALLLSCAVFFGIWLPARKSSRVTASAAGQGRPADYLYNTVLYYVPSNSTRLQLDSSLNSYLAEGIMYHIELWGNFSYFPLSGYASTAPDVDDTLPVLGLYSASVTPSINSLYFLTPCDQRLIKIENGTYFVYEDYATTYDYRAEFVSRFLNVNYYIFSSDDHSGTDSDVAYSNGYKTGYDQGHDDGYQEGWDAVDAESFYNTGYNSGYSHGYMEGYEARKSDAQDEHYDQGYEVGYTNGHEQGYYEGHNVGYDEGQEDGYNEGYNVGYDEGQEDGYQTGYNDGILLSDAYDEGYREGYSNGLNKGLSDTLTNPVSFFLQPVQAFLDTKLFGNFSIGTALNAVLFVSLALIFIKMFAGG